MSRFTKAIASPRVNIVLFVAAAILLLISVVGGTQAALSYYSDTYLARLSASSIGVTLLENGEEVAWRNYDGDDQWAEAHGALLGNMLGEGQTVHVDQVYPEELAVENSGAIAQYVRVTLLKYWEDADGNKVTTVSPDLIDIDLAEDQGWIVDEEASTLERTVLYYDSVLQPGDVSNPLTKAVSLDPAVASKVTQTTEEKDGYTTIITKFDYDGLHFCIEAVVDAVQEHNAADAILSAWGKTVTVSNGTLSVG